MDVDFRYSSVIAIKMRSETTRMYIALKNCFKVLQEEKNANVVICFRCVLVFLSFVYQ